MYAANIADLTAHAQNPADAIPLMLLTQAIDTDPEHAVECERDQVAGMGHGSPFACDEERALAIIQIIRKKYKKTQWRFYQKGKRGWKRI
jgi:hypothetical protein